jgi:ParB/RepB/Spo0J family partition protein
MKTKEVLLLKPVQLLTHPQNMRKHYPEAQVQEMADSILANAGVIEPLIVTKSLAGKYLVVDGNMRLAGARRLGDKCPALECKVMELGDRAQLLAMVSANQVRYDVDPVSEGLHYKALQDQGLSIRDISKRTGVYEARIINRIVLAKLEEPIQKLIVDGKLSSSHLVANALLKLTPGVRLRLAQKIAANPSTKIQTIIAACEKLAAGKGAEKLKHPATQIAQIQDLAGRAATKALRQAAARACEACNQWEPVPGREPAWSMLAHAADATCAACDLKEMRSICEGCPAVELLRNLKTATAGKGGKA